MAQLAPPPDQPAPAPPPQPGKVKHWTEKISRSGYFFGALLLHLVVFLMVATLVIFPPFHPPTDDFTKTYVPPSAPPPPPPPSEPNVTMPTRTVSTPTTVITAPTATASFSVPMPDLSPETTPVDVNQKMMTTVRSAPTGISTARLSKIMQTEKAWGRTRENIEESGGDPRNVTAKFPVFLAKYADGDWGCNVQLDGDGKIKYGSLPNLVAKMNEWSHNHITGGVVPEPLDIGGPELLDKKPPFIFFTGHKDFHLTDQEVKNLSDYLQIGGAIWGDNTLAGFGSRFDVAFRREMKRVVPDLDKNFEPLDPTAGKVYTQIFPRGWFPTENIPLGMNYYKEPLEHLDIDGKLAILYTPNDYSDMYSMCILPGDTEMMGDHIPLHWTGLQLFTNGIFLHNRELFFRNFQLPACLACQHLGMNIIGYMLVRFDEELLLAPP